MTEQVLGAGRYRLIAPLGTGGQGAVYRASQEPLGRPVAVKVLAPELARDPALRRRFAREARAVASLNHPNIATVFDFGAEEDGALFLVMELVEGVTLREAMRQGLTPRHLLAILDPVLRGLAYAHARGVVHRDVKPDNILIATAAQGRVPDPDALSQHPQAVKLVDFGIAHAPALGLDSPAALAGTPLYLSPEQARGEASVTLASDLYNVGLILFEGLSGRHPFANRSPDETPAEIILRHASSPPPPLRPPAGVFVGEGLRGIISKLLQKRPSERFTSAAQVRASLEEERELLEARAGSVRAVQVAAADALELAQTRRRAGAWEGAPGEAPQSAYLAAPELEARSQRGVRELPLVGREVERAALQGAVARCLVESLGQIVLLEGEAGVGKTRLATWLRERVAEAGQMRGAVGAFVRGGDGMRGVREALEQLLGGQGASRARLLALAQEALGEGEDAEALASFLRPQEAEGEGRGAEQREALSALLLRVLARLAEGRPLLLVLEDIQWAGPELASLLEFLAVEFRYRAARWMLICTIRQEEVGGAALARGLRRLARYEGETTLRLELPRLDPAQGGRLLDLALPMAPTLRADILRRAEGNPLHLVQLLQYLYQRGALSWEEQAGHFTARGDEEALQEVPPDLAALLLLRLEPIERLYETGGRLRALLERAAVLGERFSYDLLAELIALEGDEALGAFLERGVEILVEEALLAEVKGRGDELLRFHHGLAREALLQALGAEQARLHRLAGRALEALSAEHPEAVAVELAWHAEAGGEWARALGFLQQGARAALASHNPRAAVSLLSRAARLVARRGGLSDLRLLSLGREAAALLEGLGAFAAAERLCAALLRAALGASSPQDAALLAQQGLDEASPLDAVERGALLSLARRSPRRAALPAEAREDAARVTLWLGRLSRAQGHQGDAEAFLREGAAMAAEGAQAGWATFAEIELGRCAWERGDYAQARARAAAALAQAEAAGHDYNRADALRLLADVARLQGDAEAAVARLGEARALYQRLGERLRGAACLRDLASLARARGSLERAAALFTEARGEFEALGARHEAAMCLNGQGEVARYLGHLEAAEGCYLRAFEALRSLGARSDAAIALTNLGQTALMADDLEGAERRLRQAEGFAADREQPYLTLGLQLNLALLRARQGRWPQAERHLGAALEQSDRHQISDPDYARPLEALSALLEGRGDARLAADLRQRAQQMWGRLGR